MKTRGRTAGEFVLIVVGVFIALLLDAMVSERNDGELRSEYVLRLAADINADKQAFEYHNKIDISRPGWNPSAEYRETIRGIIPSDVQAQIRKACPTADIDNLVPTGFPPCVLQDIDYEHVTAILGPYAMIQPFKKFLRIVI